MPSRSTTSSVSGEERIIYFHKDGISNFDASLGPSKVTWTDTVSFGENISGWRQRLRDGLSATTAMSGSRRIAKITPGFMRASQPKETTPHYYAVEVTGLNRVDLSPGSEDPSDVPITKAEADALGRFAKNIVNARAAIQGGVFLGELGQTLRMIKNPAQGLRRLVDDWRTLAQRVRGQRIRSVPGFTVTRDGAIKKLTENLADAWLEVQFGWRPLLNDVKAGAEALRQYDVGQRLETKRVTATGREDKTFSEVTTSHNELNLRWLVTTRVTGHSQVIYRGAVRVEARDPRQMDPALLGFSPEQFLPTVWELVPYSFLIDYFSNIGDVIYGWSSLFANLAWCNRTVRAQVEKKQETRTDLDLVRSVHVNVNAVTHVPAKSVITKTSVSRAVYSGNFIPEITLDIPDMGSLKWLNIAALIAGRGNDRRWSYD